jgi:hypothetical protein
MVRPQVADGGDGIQICVIAANTLNKQQRTAEEGWAFLAVKKSLLRNVTRGFGNGRIWNDLGNGKWA